MLNIQEKSRTMDYRKEFLKFNIDAVGVCSAQRYNSACNTDYKVCIVALFPYFCGYEENSNLSIYTHGADYHIVTKNILEAVAHNLDLEDYRVHSDTGPKIERSLASEAGLAFTGRNGMAINPKYGSYFFIGYIVCNENLPLSLPLEENCKDCGRCFEMCPGKALGTTFDETKCLSAITQKKGELSDWEKELIKSNNMVFGCDICQKVCPHNRNAAYTPIGEFKENRISSIAIEDIKLLTNKEFKEKYGTRAFSWRGKNVVLRNLNIINDK